MRVCGNVVHESSPFRYDSHLVRPPQWPLFGASLEVRVRNEGVLDERLVVCSRQLLWGVSMKYGSLGCKDEARKGSQVIFYHSSIVVVNTPTLR